jgi:phosphoribosylglycinamide formyltransferase-1
MRQDTTNIAFFASGRGSNAEAILENIHLGNIVAKPVLLITNNSKAEVLKHAEFFKVPWYHISNQTHPNEEKRVRFMLELLSFYDTDLLILAGYMKKIPNEIIEAYPNKIINIHPALLPKFGGKGMYGLNVHKAVIDSEEKITGATVHIVTDEYDQGRILAQQSIEIEEGDTPESLQKKVLKIEHTLFSKVIQDIISKKIELEK